MAPNLSGKTILTGVIGHPVTHSLSPRLHGFWIYQHNIDGAYVPLNVHPDDLQEVLKALSKMGFRGVNLTLPHKELVVPMVDTLDDTAKAAGAVNTILFEEGKAHGFNTDVFGFAQNLKSSVMGLAAYKEHALIIGAGGAARAACVALKNEGWKKITVTNRTKDRADALKTALPFIHTIGWETRQSLASVTLLVNATSLGMQGKESLDISLEKLPTSSLVHDIVYNPLQTPLLKAATERGNPTVDGIGMLLWQAKPAFEKWYGAKVEVNSNLREHVLKGI
jgi:shikimate dehydrogenase